jgi:hypothetical protein
MNYPIAEPKTDEFLKLSQSIPSYTEAVKWSAKNSLENVLEAFEFYEQSLTKSPHKMIFINARLKRLILQITPLLESKKFDVERLNQRADSNDLKELYKLVNELNSFIESIFKHTRVL